MKYLFLFIGLLLLQDIYAQTPPITVQKIRTSVKLRSTYKYNTETTLYVDFWENIISRKISHTATIFPKNSSLREYIPVRFPYTPQEVDFFVRIFGEKQIHSFLYKGEYFHGRNQDTDTPKIFTHGVFEWENSDDENALVTNTLIDVEYEVFSETNKVISVKIFPLDPNHPYVNSDEAYIMSWIYDNDESAKNEFPNSWKERQGSVFPTFIFEQPLRILAPVLDAYDITISVNGANRDDSF